MKRFLSIIMLICTIFDLHTNVSAVDYDCELKTTPTPKYEQKFFDVPETYWASKYITNLADKCIINGYEDGTFRPEETVSRAEWAKMLCVLAGITPDDKSAIYADTINHWAGRYINSVMNYGYMRLDYTDYFMPDKPITRLDSVCTLLQYLEIDESEYKYVESSMFLDMNNSSFKDEIETAVHYGLVTGYEDGTFRCEAPVTRAEAAVFFNRAINIKNGLENNQNVYDQTNLENSLEQDSAHNRIQIYINGTLLPSENSPVIKDGILFVPIKIIANALDKNYVWDEESKTATISTTFIDKIANYRASEEIGIKIGCTLVTLNGHDMYTLDAAPEIINGEVMMPLKHYYNNYNIILDVFTFYYEDENMLSLVTSEAVGSSHYVLRVHPSQSCDKKGKRINFPVAYDYDVIEDIFMMEFGYTDGIEFLSGIRDDGDDDYSDVVKYIEGRLPLKGEDKDVDFNMVKDEIKYWYDYDEDMLDINSNRKNEYAFIKIYSDNWYDDFSIVYKDYEYELITKAGDEYTANSLINDIKESIEKLKTSYVLGSTNDQTYMQWLVEDIAEYIIEEDMSDIEKIKAVHDFIISNSAYDKYYWDKISYHGSDFDSMAAQRDSKYEDENYPHYAYGILILQKGVCSGFAEVFQMFMEELRIESVIVDGQVSKKGEALENNNLTRIRKQMHSWNMVNLDGNWYHIDVTWDNPSNNTISGNIKYNYFLISDSEMSSLRNWRAVPFVEGEIAETKIEHTCTNKLDVGFNRSKSEYQKPLDFWK